LDRCSLEDRAAIQRSRAKRFGSTNEQDHATSAREIAAQAEKDAQMLRAIMEKL